MPINDRLIKTVITVNVLFTYGITNCGLRYKVFANLVYFTKRAPCKNTFHKLVHIP